VVRILLGEQLRRLREAAGVTPEAAAWRIRASRSKISRMENGRSGFEQRDVSDLLELYGVASPQVAAGLLELVGQAFPDSDHPHQIIRQLMQAMPPGSYLTVSDTTGDCYAGMARKP